MLIESVIDMDHKLFHFEHPCICFKVKYKNPKDFRKVSFELLLKNIVTLYTEKHNQTTEDSAI